MSPANEAALVRQELRARRTIRRGLFGTVAGAGILAAVGYVTDWASAASRIAVTPLAWGILAVTAGAVGLRRVQRIRTLTARDGWIRRACRFRLLSGLGNGYPTLLLLAQETLPEALVSVSSTVWRWQALNEVDEVFVVGDPTTRFAAVATEDYSDVLVVKRPLLRWWERRLRRRMTAP